MQWSTPQTDRDWVIKTWLERPVDLRRSTYLQSFIDMIWDTSYRFSAVRTRHAELMAQALDPYLEDSRTASPQALT